MFFNYFLRYEDARKFKISTIFRGQSSFAQLMTNLKQYLNRKFDASVLHFPLSGPAPIYEPPMTVVQPLPLSDFDRTAAVPRVADHSVELRGLRTGTNNLVTPLNILLTPLNNLLTHPLTRALRRICAASGQSLWGGGRTEGLS